MRLCIALWRWQQLSTENIFTKIKKKKKKCSCSTNSNFSIWCFVLYQGLLSRSLRLVWDLSWLDFTAETKLEANTKHAPSRWKGCSVVFCLAAVLQFTYQDVSGHCPSATALPAEDDTHLSVPWAEDDFLVRFIIRSICVAVPLFTSLGVKLFYGSSRLEQVRWFCHERCEG